MTKQETLDALYTELETLAGEHYSLIKPVVAKLKSESGSVLDELGKVVKESIKRKEKIAELNGQITEKSEELTKIEEFKSKVQESESLVNEYKAKLDTISEHRKKELKSKIEQHKIAENEKLKPFYQSIDDFDSMTADQVETNLDKIKEHESLGAFGDFKSDKPPEKTTEEKSEFKFTDLYNTK